MPPPPPSYIFCNITQWFLLWIVDPSISFLAIFRIFHKSVFPHSFVYGLFGGLYMYLRVCVELSEAAARRQFILITTNLPSPFVRSCRLAGFEK